ncbi:chorismate synthase, partial [Staphylococcus pseudintermedius]
DSKEPFKATIERSDSCAVPAASIVCEHAVSYEIARSVLEEFGSQDFSRLAQQVAERRALNQTF